MNVRGTLLVAAAVVASLMATPVPASADPIIDNGGPFTLHSGEGRIYTPTFFIACTTVTGSGTFTSSTEGTIQLTTHACKAPLNINCTSSGQPAGTITTTSLPFHLKTTLAGTPAMLITPNSEHFASFVCSGLAAAVGGNGIIAEITDPGYNEKSSTATLVFKQSEGMQEPTTVAGSETEYAPVVSFGGGPLIPFGLESAPLLTFTEGAVTLTEE